MPEESQEHLDADSPEARLRSARLRSGKAPEDVALAAGMSGSSYYDLESCPGELMIAISLKDLKKVCDMIGCSVSSLFADRVRNGGEPILPEDIVCQITEFLRRHEVDISEFEDDVGFEIRQCTRDSSSILEWNVDCLRAVCGKLGLDWHTALP
jgi:transcriptional regulator with XRE-family HTH domain